MAGMRTVTRREEIKAYIAEQIAWLKPLGDDYNNYGRWPMSAGGRRRKLELLNPETCTEAELNSSNWSHGAQDFTFVCDECDQEIDAALYLDGRDENDAVIICKECLARGVTLLNMPLRGQYDPKSMLIGFAVAIAIGCATIWISW